MFVAYTAVISFRPLLYVCRSLSLDNSAMDDCDMCTLSLSLSLSHTHTHSLSVCVCVCVSGTILASLDRYKSAAENRKNLRIVAAAQLVYHMVSYIFMEAALARGQKVR